MIIIFVSECEKKARKTTFQILDNFAERIGRSTWKTRMTMEGLKSVKILLSKKATRNTSVACHRVLGYTNTRLLWIVGNKRKFNRYGIIPTNITGTESIGITDNDWRYLELIKVLTAIAALFHDWGKAWNAFQSMLKDNTHTDYIRHEYVSLILWAAFVRERTAFEWMSALRDSKKLNENRIFEWLNTFSSESSPFDFLPDQISKTIGWLIISHHLLPDPPKDDAFQYIEATTLLNQIKPHHGYMKKIQDRPLLEFSIGLPCGPAWLKQASKWAKRGLEQLEVLQLKTDTLNSLLRPIAHTARLAVMVGDHLSSFKEEKQDRHIENNPEKQLWAKSIGRSDNKSPVLLEEHLLGVTKEALAFCHFFPYLENKLACVESPDSIEKRATGDFAWQDKATDYIRGKIKEVGPDSCGFFGVNMASTGTGKTFGNAKIMHAVQGGKLRYTLALGLRTLTLQSGDEYRERIGLDETELAVVIGSAAIKKLHEKQHSISHEDKWDIYSDWQEISYACPALDKKLVTKLHNKKARQILYSPILVCTIDHLMGATEATKKGRHIIPWLRILSSDLVIDEIDDFDGNDLIAIMRLVHLSGMLGRKVLISSATIPPAVAESTFTAYHSGWELFARMRGRKNTVMCAWIDEFKGSKIRYAENLEQYRGFHARFIQSRIKNLRLQPSKRKAQINDVHADRFGRDILEAALILHDRHAWEIDAKRVSFGVIRMANITPCVAVSKYLLQTKDLPEDTSLRVLTYHSRFPLITRHFIEIELDSALKRKDPQQIFYQQTIRKHIKDSQKKNILFIVVATPVEEVGRDHDFDWAVLEPSSVRSLIQMAGRVLRHRAIYPEQPNLIILNRNLNALLNKEISYTRPGYESPDFKLKSHDLNDLMDKNIIGQRVDAAIRISRIRNPDPSQKMPDLEQCYMDKFLLDGNAADSASVIGWNNGPWHLVTLAQQKRPFRQSLPEENLYLLPDELSFNLKFFQKDDNGKMSEKNKWVHHETLNIENYQRLWLPVNYAEQLENIGKTQDITVTEAGKRYGSISVPLNWLENSENKIFKFNPDLGLWEDKGLNFI